MLFLTNNEGGARLSQWLRPRVESLDLREDRIDLAALEGVDLVVSYGYRHILPAAVLAGCRCINLHVSLLPWNRGADPNVWSQLEGTPGGVSIHEMDSGIDTGPILVQRALSFNEEDTLAGSYAALCAAIEQLFQEHWPALADGSLRARPQQGAGSFHRAREFAAIREQLLGEEGWNVSIRVLRERWQGLRAGE